MLGLDLGSRRIGVAISDAARILATPYETINRVGDRSVEHARIGEIIASESAVAVVVGMPLSLSGEVGPAARAVRSELKGLRRRLGVPVDTVDERLTTVSAEAELDRMGVDNRRRREMVDQIAAAVLLQAWLDRRQR